MDILNIIARLQEKRRSDKITPDHVPEMKLMKEIHEEIEKEARKELNALYTSGKIGITRTLNSKGIYIKPK